jgi:glycosyltransferase involved in cell wall biosynthesis
MYRRLLTRLADGTVANTDAAKKDVESALGSSPNRVHRVCLLVPPTRDDLTRADAEIALRGTRPIFLYVGQLIERKNVAALLDAAAMLQRDGLTFSVWIVGDGPLSSALARNARHQGLSHCVRFIRSIPYDAIGHLYSFCDVFVMPSLYDYRSVAVLEAVRFGKPVIDSSRDGNSDDSVRNGRNGFIFEPSDTARLAWAMRQFIESPRLTAEMGRRSAESLSDQTPASAAAALRNVLADLASDTVVSERGDWRKELD